MQSAKHSTSNTIDGQIITTNKTTTFSNPPNCRREAVAPTYHLARSTSRVVPVPARFLIFGHACNACAHTLCHSATSATSMRASVGCIARRVCEPWAQIERHNGCEWLQGWGRLTATSVRV